MAKLEDYVWSYVQTELKILRKMKQDNNEAWKEKKVKLNQWLLAYKHEVVEDEKYIFTIKELK